MCRWMMLVGLLAIGIHSGKGGPDTGTGTGPDTAAVGWAYKRAVSMAPAQGIRAQTNFIVRVEWQDESLRSVTHGGHVARDNGGDILFLGDTERTLFDYRVADLYNGPYAFLKRLAIKELL